MSDEERALQDRMRSAMNPRPTVGNGADEDDPFAPLPPDEAAEAPKTEGEIWDWHNPAPEPLPELSSIRWPGYGAAVRIWIYRDVNGQPMFIVARFERVADDGTIKKDTIPYSFGRRVWTTKAKNRLDKTGWHFKRPVEPVPLYGLDRLAAKPDAPVVLVEGEKAADAAAELFPDHVAISSQGGSKSAGKADWTALIGRSVVIWPDHDAPGLSYAKHARHQIMIANVGSQVGVVEIPSAWPEGWDVADAQPDGVTVETLTEMLNAAGERAADPEQQASDVRQVEIERLSKLPSADYQVVRKDAASGLNMGVTALDKLIKAEKAKRAAAAAAEARGRPPPLRGEIRWPIGFFMRRDGLYFEAEGDGADVWICPPFDVLGEGRDPQGEGWGLWLEWADRDQRIHRWAMPKRLLMVGPGEMEAELVDRGLSVSADAASRALLRKALGDVKSGYRVITVDQPGWHRVGSKMCYILPDGTAIGDTEEHVVLRSMAESAQQMVACKGTLQSWQDEVAAKAKGNNVAAFCLCFGFAGPVMDVANEVSGGFHLFGRSKVGKTLAARLAISVWGKPQKGLILRDWRSTSNGMELAAADSNDGLLVLDEIHQVEPREVLAVIYMLANESGKARARRDITSAKKKTWRVPILSTGEVDVAAVAGKAGQNLTAGAQVRLPSLPMDTLTMWPELHGEPDARRLMTTLSQAVLEQYGVAGRLFLEKLTAARNADGDDLSDAVGAMQSKFARMVNASADQQVHDVARRFALLAFAGEMAIAWDILPWNKDDAIRACRAILELWLKSRGGGGSAEDAAHERTIRLFLVENGAARFVRIWQNIEQNSRWEVQHPERQVINRAGWVHKTSDGRDEYFIDPDVWKNVCVAAGHDPAETAKTLKAKDFLATVPGAKHLTQPKTIPGLGRPRVYVVKPELLEGEVDPPNTPP